MRRLAVVLIGLSLFGGKCRGPRPPRAEAVDAVEEAFVTVDVVASLATVAWVDVEIDIAVDDPAIVQATAVVRFSEGASGIEATTVIGPQRYAFRMTAEGEAIPVPEALTEAR